MRFQKPGTEALSSGHRPQGEGSGSSFVIWSHASEAKYFKLIVSVVLDKTFRKLKEEPLLPTVLLRKVNEIRQLLTRGARFIKIYSAATCQLHQSWRLLPVLLVLARHCLDLTFGLYLPSLPDAHPQGLSCRCSRARNRFVVGSPASGWPFLGLVNFQVSSP